MLSGVVGKGSDPSEGQVVLQRKAILSSDVLNENGSCSVAVVSSKINFTSGFLHVRCSNSAKSEGGVDLR